MKIKIAIKDSYLFHSYSVCAIRCFCTIRIYILHWISAARLPSPYLQHEKVIWNRKMCDTFRKCLPYGFWLATETNLILARCWRVLSPCHWVSLSPCLPVSLHTCFYIFLKSARIIVLCIHITYITENIFAKAVAGDENVHDAQHTQAIYSSICWLSYTNFMEYILQALVGTVRNGKEWCNIHQRYLIQSKNTRTFVWNVSLLIE